MFLKFTCSVPNRNFHGIVRAACPELVFGIALLYCWNIDGLFAPYFRLTPTPSPHGEGLSEEHVYITKMLFVMPVEAVMTVATPIIP